ncbi:MAG TPA: TolC family protein [Candidatus Binatia bacterium]|nr:TolC family protein [Candidatus Binatia bacterium]
MVLLLHRSVFACTITVLLTTGTPALGDERVPAPAGAASPNPEEPGEPTGPLTLPLSLSIALRKSPELAEFAWEIRVSEARVLQAGLGPNPELSLLAEDVLGTGSFEGVRQSQTTLEIGQLLELGGKRRARIEAASRSRDVASAEYEVKRADVLADVTRKFIQLLERQDLRGAAEADAALGRASLATVSKRIRAGAGSPLEEKKARVALARSEVALEDASHDLAVARHLLAATWGASSDRFGAAEGDLYARRPVPSFDELLERLRSAPELLRRVSEIRLREAELRTAEAKKVPNLGLRGGVRWLEGPEEESFVFGFSMPLPLFDRNQGGLEEARALVAKAKAAETTSETRLRATLFTLHQELLHAAHRLDSLEKDILPRSEESVGLSQEGFNRGAFSFLDLLDARRTLVEVKRERIEAAASYHQFILEIERLIGAPIDALAVKP